MAEQTLIANYKRGFMKINVYNDSVELGEVFMKSYPIESIKCVIVSIGIEF